MNARPRTNEIADTWHTRKEVKSEKFLLSVQNPVRFF
jgi:hypothetical protein